MEEKNTFLLQWHITAKCQQHCKHCYMYDEPTYKSEIENELDFNTCLKILDDFKDFCEIMNVKGQIAFTGGDPLLRGDLLELIKEAKKRGFKFNILGNPFKLNDEILQELKKLDITSYQISLDGLEKMHDSFRKKGSFSSSINSIKALRKAKIPVNVMMTLSKTNKNDLLPLMELVSDLGVDKFAFGRIACNGSAKEFKELNIAPFDYKNLLLDVQKKRDELIQKGSKTEFVEKCHLWKLLRYEQNDFDFIPGSDMIFGGCSLGINSMVLLADGTAMACRRFPSYIGKVPEQKFIDIFLNSKAIKEYRDVSKLEKCSKCELLSICRGCPAVSYGIHNDWKAADPQCWKGI